MEAKWRSKHGQSTSMYSFLYERSSSIITTIIENLQFEIHDVHLRYEDNETLPQNFACGIVIKNLTSKTTDEKWVPNSEDRSSKDMMYKLLQLDGFSIYWDPESKIIGDLSREELNTELRYWEQDSSTSIDANDREHFLLSPVCGETKVTKNSSLTPLRSKTSPRLLLEVLLGEISLHLSHSQYKQAIALASELSMLQRRKSNQDGRPDNRPQYGETAGQWWKWAVETHLKQIRRQRERGRKDFLLNRGRNNVEYVKCYEKVIKSKTELVKISNSEMTRLENKLLEIEKQMIVPEIQILREIVYERTEKALSEKRMKKEKPTTKAKEGSPSKKGWGSWLRGWATGWGSQEAEQPSEADSSSESAGASADNVLQESTLEESVYKDLDEEELYELFGEELSEQDTNDTFMKRDTVFMKLNFKLDAGTLTLHEDSLPDSAFLGIEFRDVTTVLEWKPRHRSRSMKTDLGSLFVKDLSNRKSQFSDLIKPQGFTGNTNTLSKDTEKHSSFKDFFNLLSNKNQNESGEKQGGSVFSLLYRNQPITNLNRFANRLEIASAPIVITYLPNLVERVKNFFKSVEYDDVDYYDPDEGISAAALERYENWKRKSQQEIQRSVKRMMNGKITRNVSQDEWGVTLSISAPEIILPEDVNDMNTDIVIANLGHMKFKNHNEDDLLAVWEDRNKVESLSQDNELVEDDDFVTPPDTPTNGTVDSKPTKDQSDEVDAASMATEGLSDSPSQLRLNEKLMHEKMYEKFQIRFTDLQVLVAKSGENWEATRNQGKGPHHVIEQFSVDVLMERRVVQTLDPKCPAVKLKGNLPSLTIHLNRDKIHSFSRCLSNLSTSEEEQQETDILNESTKGDDDSASNSRTALFHHPNQFKTEQALSKQLLCQFSMNEVSILLEDGSASPLSVLEIKGIQAEFTKRPFDYTSLLSIHSILLVDTKQEIGHDYELLLASNQNVKMDLGSGNILDSGSTSPIYEGQQSASKEIIDSPPTKSILSSVANSLKQTKVFQFSEETPSTETVSNYDDVKLEEDLITVEWTVHQLPQSRRNSSSDFNSPKTPSSTANIKFNSLDLVLNLKTWIALLDFLHRLKPQESKKRVPSAKKLDFDKSSSEQSVKIVKSDMPENFVGSSPENGADMEVFVQFNELNILLMRHIENPDKVIGRKVATLSMHNTMVHALLGDNVKKSAEKSGKEEFFMSIDAQGSVGGLALQDLTNAVRDSRGNLHGMQVLCLGKFTNSGNEMKNKIGGLDNHSGKEAFKFVMQKGKRKFFWNSEKQKREVDDIQFQMDTDDFAKNFQEEIILNFHLASVLYMHTPRLIAEVLAISDEAGDIINAKMNPDTMQAVKDMAYSFMDKSMAVLSTYQLTDSTDSGATPEKTSQKNLRALFKLAVDMQSPVVALPKCHGSFELLVANLGKITVKNGHALNRVVDHEDAMDFLCIEITDMSVCSKRQIEEEKIVRKSPKISKPPQLRKTASGPSLTKLKDSMNSKDPNSPILHDTSIRLTVVKEEFNPQNTVENPLDRRFPIMNSDGTSGSDEVDDGPISDKKMSVDVKMTLPLTVTLSKAAYEQLLKTMDHISYGGNIDFDDIEELNDSSFSQNLDTSTNSKNATMKSDADSVTSFQSTPSHGGSTKIFDAPGLDITPSVSQTQSELSVTTRKYTPISANITIPQIELQLTQEVDTGEEGAVKVTLEGFSAKFDKENRSTTALDLTLGSLHIEDLFQDEDSPHRHIVSSISYSLNLAQNKEYLSSSCPDLGAKMSNDPGGMSSSLPASNGVKHGKDIKTAVQRNIDFRPFYSSGAFGVSTTTHRHQAQKSRNLSDGSETKCDEGPLTPPGSPVVQSNQVDEIDETLVRIRAFLVDGKSTAYTDLYNRTNRRIDIDFNSLDCKITPYTWVILLDFFGIGTAPKKTYQVDPETEKEYNTERRLAVSSYYENQPDDFINSEIDFKVRSFSLIFNKEEYEFVKANISNFGTHVQIRDGVLGVSGQLGSLSVSDLSPNGAKYRERFVFSGEKALDFDIKKYDEYDEELKREFDIRVKLRMSAINYVHTHRFHQELVAYLLHFQQLQEVLGHMRAASVGQEVNSQSRRQARILMDIEADSPVVLIPESSHSDRVIVTYLGNLTVKNSFKWSGDPGTLCQDREHQISTQINPDLPPNFSENPDRTRCLLDVLFADLDQMDLYTAIRSDRSFGKDPGFSNGSSYVMFPSFFVKKNTKPLLTEKCKLSLQIERNLEKETDARIVPDTSVSGQLSSVYCTLDLQQYWLVRGILDHNLGEPIPEFPQRTASMQPTSIQTVLSNVVYTGMSIDMHLLNVSVELLRRHGDDFQDDDSLARLDYVKSRLSYRSFSNQTKTINLSCETFVGSDLRWKSSTSTSQTAKKNEFTTVLGPTYLSKMNRQKKSNHDCLLQFELQLREGPNFFDFTALLVDMRVYIIPDWLADLHKYIIVNPDQPWCDSLRAKAAELLTRYKQYVPGQEAEKDQTLRDEQFKLNVTGTDFVLVENSSRKDSDAVILRMTSVLHYNPSLPKLRPDKSNDESKKLLSCTLQSLEVFSCQLSLENDTELSIVDPMRVNIEINPIIKRDLTIDERNNDPALLDRNKLEVSVHELNTRVSYNDLLLFLAITKSFAHGKEEEPISNQNGKVPSSISGLVFQPPEEDVERLMELGFARSDVLKALNIENGNIDSSGEWLLKNALIIPKDDKVEKETTKVPFDIGKMLIDIGSMSVCLIDDCADSDVPLGEFAMKKVHAEQNLSVPPAVRGNTPTCYAGKANFVLSGDYYNRMLSLWEPYLEPWRCSLNWNYDNGTIPSLGKWDVKVRTSDRLDISVTSTMIETIKKTKDSWTRAYGKLTKQPEDLIDLGQSGKDNARTRKEFVPYVLRNLTGAPLQFATHVSAIQQPSSLHNIGAGKPRSKPEEVEWLTVMPGDSHHLRFDKNEKQRHKRSEKTILHQIITKLAGWETLPPVTISKVGVYFRHAVREIVSSSSVYSPLDPVRVVFAVTLEGSAQKVVTVRSALVIRSMLKIPVQIYLVNNVSKPIVLPRLDPGEVQYIPVNSTGHGVKIRPVFSSRIVYRYSNQTIQWSQMNRDADFVSDMMICPCESDKQLEPFRFGVCVKKKKFPSLEDVVERLADEHPQGLLYETKIGQTSPYMPGHTIIILPPVVVSNLLPCELQYYFKQYVNDGQTDSPAGGKLTPGQDATLHMLNLIPGSPDEPPLVLGCGLEGYRKCRELTIPHVEKNSQMRMALIDHENRTLILNVRVMWRLGCSVKISIMAGYWIVNKTGLPIVIKQDGADTSFAGQYEEHEKARSLMPLLFSYSNRDLPYLCTMRLGKESNHEVRQTTNYPHGAPSTPFCQSFSIDGGTCTRQLKMSNHDNSPSRVYYIGVGVTRGWGRYLHTHIVNLAPRFLLLNMTKERTLSFAQKHATSFTDDAAGLNRHLTINAGSSIVFHWPRADLDLLLCTRLKDEPSCLWSGGFIIDKINAFHVHLRVLGDGLSSDNYSVFLRVEITLVDATYRVMFFDGDISSCPSPLRIDNISSAPLVIKQSNTAEGLQIPVPPSSQVPYACDEPCLPPLIDCKVRGASNSACLDMDNIGEEKALHYDNFIYIVVGLGSSYDATCVNDDHQLVLAVKEDSDGHSVDGMHLTVMLEPREPGKRSQLWQMTPEGFLRHEGSSPPMSGSKDTSPGMSVPSGLVLDIAELMWRDGVMPLTVRSIDPTRRSQFWKFTDEGRLCCGIGEESLCVQMYTCNVVGLGLYTTGGVVTPNQHCRRENMIAGSGVLSLKVVRDGPTRVIRVIDIKQKRAGLGQDSGRWSLVTRQPSSHSVDPVSFDQKDSNKYLKLNLNVDMARGVGVSLISNTPEELLYLTLFGVRMDASLNDKNQTFSLRIQKIQIDNQLFGGRPQVLLHPFKSSVVSSSQSSSTDPPPSLSIEAVKLPSTNKLYDIYHSLSINIGKMCLLLEERLLLMLIQFFDSGISTEDDKSLLDESQMDLTQNMIMSDISASRRYYFDKLKISIESPMHLSVYTASSSNLEPELKVIKQSSRLVLIQFERAPVMMQSYEKDHIFESSSFIIEEYKKHFTDQLRGQAARILGSVDFLGNPIGLLSDLKAGLGSFVRGRPTGTLKYFTHGLSNSAAKVTGTLSTLSGGITMDQEHEDKRRAIRSNTTNASDHFVAGLQSLGTGLVGGLTSIVTQTVKGASDEGAKGFFTGFGKGLVGTVTKPVTGVLDFASGTASFVRETSASTETQFKKVRLPRNCHSFQGCLEAYNQKRAEDQRFLHQINSNDYGEFLYSMVEFNRRGSDSMVFLITNKKLYLTRSNRVDEGAILLQVDYNQLVQATAVQQQNEWCFELTYKMDSTNAGAPMHYSSSLSNLRSQLKKPRIVCNSELTAKRICEHANYAKILAAGLSETLPSHDDDMENDKTFDLEV